MQEVGPHLFVILGGTGDLTRRKLLPSLYGLIGEHRLWDRCIVVGAATTDTDDDGYRGWAREALADAGLASEQIREWCDRSVYYQQITKDPDGYHRLAKRLAEIEAERDLPGNRAFYLALPPTVVPFAINGLGDAGLNRGPGWTRLVIEKPFGRDLESARQLNEVVHRYFDESEVYRIDHYLGKETVQNLLVFRFANPLFETAWSRDRIQNVQITVAEDLGIEGRADFYEQAGALRDIVQNHLTQVLTLVAMHPPLRFDAEAIRNEKIRVLQAISPIEPADVVFGQYTSGTVAGRSVPGYRDEDDVAPDSATETFVALRINIDTWRWHGVPFYLRTGKRLPRRLTQIVVTFQSPPVCLFHGTRDSCQAQPNVLLITLQPNEGFALLFGVKVPQATLQLKTLPLHFQYDEVFEPLPEAYQTLIMDVIQGDQTLFVRNDETEASWRLYDRVLEQRPTVHSYPAGTWGPEQADRLLEGDGHEWVVR
ncbi:MAG: glucose-6-phosphate dehydrogenase [Acidimicrobiia bacterium]